MFLHQICHNINILAVMNDQKNDFGFHSNQKTQGQNHQFNNLYFKYQGCQIELIFKYLPPIQALLNKPHCRFVFLERRDITRLPHGVTQHHNCFHFDADFNLQMVTQSFHCLSICVDRGRRPRCCFIPSNVQQMSSKLGNMGEFILGRQMNVKD